MGYTKEQREANAAKKRAELEATIRAEIKSELKNKESKVEIDNTDTNTKLNINNIPTHTMINVRSNCFGGLVYISKKSGFEIEWNDNTTPIPFTLEELLIMRNSQIKFFTKNWIVIDGFVDKTYSDMFSPEDLYKHLQVMQYYKDFVCPEDIDSLFKMSPEQIKQKVTSISKDKKDFIVIRANELIKNGKLDSIKVVKALEESLNCELLNKDNEI